MATCVRLFRADDIRAFYVEQEKLLVIAAEVTLNPYADDVGICRNPLQRLLPSPAVSEYMVAGTTRPGIHPQIVVTRTIQGHFSIDTKPERVAVFSMGIDNPARVEVEVDLRTSAARAEGGDEMVGEGAEEAQAGPGMAGAGDAAADPGMAGAGAPRMGSGGSAPG